jgi:hypothetical protein
VWCTTWLLIPEDKNVQSGGEMAPGNMPVHDAKKFIQSSYILLYFVQVERY